jgi:hypothetical protein
VHACVSNLDKQELHTSAASTPRHTASQRNGHSSHSHQCAHQSQQQQQQQRQPAARYGSAPSTPLFTANTNTAAATAPAAAAAALNASRTSVTAAELSRSGSLSPSRVYGLGPRGRQQQQPRQQQQQQYGSSVDASSSAALKHSEHFQLNTSSNSGVAARSPAVSQW